MYAKSYKELESASIKGTTYKAMTISSASRSESLGISISDIKNPVAEGISTPTRLHAPAITMKFHTIAILILLLFI